MSFFDPDRWIVTVFWTSLMVGCAVIILAVLVALDCTSSQSQPTSTCTVVEKTFTPAHTTLTYIGKVMYPIFHPDSWSVMIQSGNKTGRVEVSRDEFEKLNIGDSFPAHLQVGSVLGLWWGFNPEGKKFPASQ